MLLKILLHHLIVMAMGRIQHPLQLVIMEFLLLWLGMTLEMQVAWLLVHTLLSIKLFTKALEVSLLMLWLQ
uniref:Uncharacterized protein n=1 Tax=Arundo donax TaxID=35708 RepID=A0A0A9EUR8_ARUDO